MGGDKGNHPKRVGEKELPEGEEERGDKQEARAPSPHYKPGKNTT